MYSKNIKNIYINIISIFFLSWVLMLLYPYPDSYADEPNIEQHSHSHPDTPLMSSPDSYTDPRVKDIERELMCICEDKCGKMLSNCTCKYSDKMRQDISLMLKDGLTKAQVIESYTKRYGEKALSAPTKRGFNLTAWITPFVAIIIGGWAIKKVLSKWVSQKKTNDATLRSAPNIASLSEINNNVYKERLKKELDKFE